MPSSFTASAHDESGDVEVEIRATFDGQRLEAVSASYSRTDGASLSASDVVSVPLAAVVHEVGLAAVSPGHGAFLDRRPGRRPTPDELEMVAAVYWFQYATWGHPREAIMATWGIPRTTANRWIRQARELYPLPGHHSTGE